VMVGVGIDSSKGALVLVMVEVENGSSMVV